MLTIQYLNAPEKLTRLFGEPLYIDIGGGEEIRMTKALDKFDEYGIVTQEASLGFSIPATNRNKAILEQFNPDVINRKVGFIPVQVTQNGEATPVTGISIVKLEDDNFESEGFAKDWITSLEGFLIKDLGTELGTYEFTKANVEASWNGDLQQLVMPLLADFGQFGTDAQQASLPGEVQMSDLRFAFNLPLLIKQVFCALNPKWSFQSSYFDNEGANLYAYLSGSRWYSYSGKRDQFFVNLNVPSFILFGAEENFFPTFNEVQDDDNVYNNVGILPNAYILATAFDYNSFDISFEIKNLVVTLPKTPNGKPFTFTFSIFRLKGYGPDAVEYIHKETVLGSADQAVTKTLNFTVSDRVFALGYVYGFSLSYKDQSVVDGPYSSFVLQSIENIYIRPDTPRYVEGDTIPLHEIIDPNLTALDLIKSMAHLINAKFYTDQASQTVYMYPPYSYAMPDGVTKVEGFFQDGPPIDLRDNTISVEWENKEQTRSRFVDYRFLSGDGALLAENDEDRFNRVVDRGTGENKTDDVESPVFVATGEVQVDSDYVGGTGGITVPAIWEDDSGSAGVRPLIFYGKVEQIDINQDVRTFVFEGDTYVEVPYFSQCPRIQLPDDVDIVPLTFAPGYDRNLYNLFYAKENESCKSGIVFKLLLTGGDDTYYKIDFRRTILVQGETSAIEIQPTVIKDHVISSQIPVLVEGRLS